MYSVTAGFGAYLPKKIVTNKELEARVETSDEWIMQRTGISERHIAAPEETASTLAAQAARDALAVSGVSAAEIDCVIVATTTPDKIFPSTACLLQEQLNIPVCPAFDVSAVCSGFVYGMTVADKFIKTGQATRCLLVGTEVLSRVVDWNDRTTCVLFGDGAGACVLTASTEPGIHVTLLGADGRHHGLLYTDNCQTTLSKDPYIHMKGRELFRVAVNAVVSTVTEAIAKSGFTLEEIDWIVPHQANDRIIDAIATGLHFPSEKMISTIRGQANTSAASIPLAFKTAIDDGRIQRGNRVLLTGFGAGMTWGTVILTY